MGFDPVGALKRAFTLPKRYNSLSDIAKDPLGAIGNALPYIALATGMGWISIPGIPAGWLKGGLSAKGISGALGNIGQWISKNPAQAAMLGASLWQMSQAGKAGAASERQMSDLQNLYGQLFQMSMPLAQALQAARLGALAGMGPTADNAIALARRGLDAQLQNIQRLQGLSGLRALSYDRMRGRALADFGANVASLRAQYPMQYFRSLMGYGPGYDTGALAGLTNLSAARLQRDAARESSLYASLASVLPYILEEV